MKLRLKSWLLVFFALTTLLAGLYAWQQKRSLLASHNQEKEAWEKERATLQKRLTETEHRAHDLENKLAALSNRPSGDAPPDDEQPGSNPDRARFRSRGPEAFMAMMTDPKMNKLMNARERTMLDSRYASLFKSLMQGSAGAAQMLTPQQLENFKDLLVEKQNTLRDVVMSARSQGITDRSEIGQMVQSAQADLDTQIQSVLGPDGYTQYQQYEKTLPQRTVVNQLGQSLSYTATPLTDDQSQQLVQILSENTSTDSPRRSGEGIGLGGPVGPFGGGARITDAAITQAQSVLAPAQVQALTNLQQEQKAQEELMQSLRAARQAGASSGTAGAPAAPSAPKANP